MPRASRLYSTSCCSKVFQSAPNLDPTGFGRFPVFSGGYMGSCLLSLNIFRFAECSSFEITATLANLFSEAMLLEHASALVLLQPQTERWKRMSPFAGMIQIKFNRMISERLRPNTGLHAAGSYGEYLDHETMPRYLASWYSALGSEKRDLYSSIDHWRPRLCHLPDESLDKKYD